MKLIVILIHSILLCLSNTGCDGKQLLEPKKKKEREREKEEKKKRARLRFRIIIKSVFSIPLHKSS